MTRGSTRGTRTMAISLLRCASEPFKRTMKFSDLLATSGNGWGRVQPHGIEQRLHFTLEILLHPAALLGRALAVRDDADAFGGKAGTSASLYSAYWRSTKFCALAIKASQVATVQAPSWSPDCVAVMGRGAHLKKLIQVRGNDAQGSAGAPATAHQGGRPSQTRAR